MTGDSVYSDFLFIEKDVVADLRTPTEAYKWVRMKLARLNLSFAERTNSGRPSASPVIGSPDM